MSGIPPTMHTTPTVTKPYGFPTTIPAIDPWLSSSSPSRTTRSKVSGEDLEQLVRITAEEDPWGKPYGQITKAWERVLKQLQLEQCFKNSHVTTLQNKINCFIAWQEVC